MAKVMRRYHSKKTGKYISRKQWLKEGKKGVNKREKIGVGQRKKREITSGPGVPEKTVERLQYTNTKGSIDIDIIRIGGKLSQVKISKRGGHTKTYSSKSSIAKFSSLIYNARTQATLTKRKRILEELEN